MPGRRHRSLIPLAALLAVLPLLLHGPTCGHDFDFHLLSWLEAATQLAHGQYPHWAYTPAFNAGEPRFLFYPPISWTLGALLTLIMPIQFVGTAFTFCSLTLAGFTAHRLARSLTPDPDAATLAAIVYTLNPYMLFTAYERSAFAELLAAAFLPLLFQAALSLRPKIHQIAIPVALIWLTNAPAGVMATYALAILTLTRLVLPHPGAPSTAPLAMGGSTSKLNLTLTTLAGTAQGLLLPAFYLIPAAYEQRWVQITLATIEGMRPRDHFLFHRMAGGTPDDLFHNAVVRTASEVALILLLAILVAAGVRWTRRPPGCPTLTTASSSLGWVSPMLTLVPLTLLIAFLLTPISQPLWTHIPKLAFLQFPWRLSALLAVILLTTLATIRVPHVSLLRHGFLPPALAALLILPAYTLFHQPCDATDTPTARAALFHSPLGTEATDEYTPTTATDPDALTANDPPSWFTCLGADADPNVSPTSKQTPGPAPAHLTLDLPCRALVILNRRQYPAWTVTLNGRVLQQAASPRQDGLIVVEATAGRDTIDLTWQRTPDQTLGLILSALAVLLLALAIRFSPATSVDFNP